MQSLEILEVTPKADLLDKVRETHLRGKPDTSPYRNAAISIERFRLSELVPTTRYIEAGLLAVQGALREQLQAQGHDQLNMHYGLTYRTEEGVFRLAPPVVERYEHEGRTMTPYILDGSHRTQLCREVSEDPDPEMSFIYVRNGITDPPYSYPNGWDEVVVMDKRPDDKSTWKNYREFENRYDLYRDYNHFADSVPRGLD